MLLLFYSATETVAPVAEQVSATPPNLILTVLASAFGGAILTGAITIWSKKLDLKAEQQKRAEDLVFERERWIREEKLSVYTKYLTVARSCMNAARIRARNTQASATRMELIPLSSHLRLLAGDQIANQAVSFNTSLKRLVRLHNKPEDFLVEQEITRKKFSVLLEFMQKDLGIETQNQAS